MTRVLIVTREGATDDIVGTKYQVVDKIIDVASRMV